MKKLSVFMLFAIMLSFAMGCGKDPEPAEEMCDPLENIIGLWNLDRVDASSSLGGSDTDSMPTGNITFLDDNQAVNNFSFSVYIAGASFSREDDTIQYSLDMNVPPTFMDVIQSDGEEFKWDLESVCENALMASFPYPIDGFGTVDLRVHLSR